MICTRSNQQLNAIKVAYEGEFHRSLESAVKWDTSGDFERLLVALLQARRDESNVTNPQKAREVRMMSESSVFLKFPFPLFVESILQLSERSRSSIFQVRRSNRLLSLFSINCRLISVQPLEFVFGFLKKCSKGHT